MTKTSTTVRKHSLNRRPPLMSAGVAVVRRWAGPTAADRLGFLNGLAILQGLPFKPPPPAPRARKWFSWLTG